MSSWKLLKSVSQSFSHHLQSYFGYMIPHISEELKRINEKSIKIKLLPNILIPEDIGNNKNLRSAIENNLNMFYKLLEKNDLEFNNISDLEIYIELRDYVSMDSKIETIIKTKDKRVISAEINYIIDGGTSKIKVSHYKN